MCILANDEFVLYRSDEPFHVFLYGSNTADAEGIYQNLGYIRRQEGRKCRAQVNVLHAQMQQRQQYNHRFLLIPGNVIGDRKIVDIRKTEDFLQLKRYNHKRIGVIALAGIKHAGNSPISPSASLLYLYLAQPAVRITVSLGSSAAKSV